MVSCAPKPSQTPAGRVVHQRQQTAVRAAIFEPRMETAIELHQLAEVPHAGATTPMRTALAGPAPQPGRHHPAPQRFVIDRDPVFTRQMLRRERRPESLVHTAAVFLANQRQHPLLRPRRRRPIRGASGAPMFEALRTLGAVAAVQALRLPVAHLHQLGRRSQLQGPRGDARQDPRTLCRTHRRPPQSTTSSEVVSLGGHF
jgi:hypothetical protein